MPTPARITDCFSLAVSRAVMQIESRCVIFQQIVYMHRPTSEYLLLTRLPFSAEIAAIGIKTAGHWHARINLGSPARVGLNFSVHGRLKRPQHVELHSGGIHQVLGATQFIGMHVSSHLFRQVMRLGQTSPYTRVDTWSFWIQNSISKTLLRGSDG